MKGWFETDMTFLSVRAYQVRFFSTILSFFKTFMAYSFPVEFHSTRKTSPKDPVPIDFRTVKSLGEILMFPCFLTGLAKFTFPFKENLDLVLLSTQNES